MIDLKQPYKEGIENILKWRSRYSIVEYPEKIVLNIFYRKFTMDFLWANSTGLVFKTFEEGVLYFKNLYSAIAVKKVQPILVETLKNNSDKIIGGIRHNDFTKLINEIKQGNIKAKEEIEFNYLYYLLADECVLYWLALNATGVKQIDSISRLSGFILEEIQIDNYSTISTILGQLCAGQYLKNNYAPF